MFLPRFSTAIKGNKSQLSLKVKQSIERGNRVCPDCENHLSSNRSNLSGSGVSSTSLISWSCYCSPISICLLPLPILYCQRILTIFTKPPSLPQKNPCLKIYLCLKKIFAPKKILFLNKKNLNKNLCLRPKKPEWMLKPKRVPTGKPRGRPKKIKDEWTQDQLLQIEIICVEADLRFYHDNLNKESEHLVFALPLYLMVFYSFPFCQLKAAQCQ